MTNAPVPTRGAGGVLRTFAAAAFLLSPPVAQGAAAQDFLNPNGPRCNLSTNMTVGAGQVGGNTILLPADGTTGAFSFLTDGFGNEPSLDAEVTGSCRQAGNKYTVFAQGRVVNRAAYTSDTQASASFGLSLQPHAMPINTDYLLRAKGNFDVTWNRGDVGDPGGASAALSMDNCPDGSVGLGASAGAAADGAAHSGGTVTCLRRSSADGGFLETNISINFSASVHQFAGNPQEFAFAGTVDFELVRVGKELEKVSGPAASVEGTPFPAPFVVRVFHNVSNAAYAGEPVRFRLLKAGVELAAADAVTASDGKASAAFTPASSGTYRVQAFCAACFADNQSPGTGSTVAFDVNVAEAAPPRIAVTAPPQAAAGGSLGPVAGTAADDIGLQGVDVAAWDSGSGRWWDNGGFTSPGPVWAAATPVSGTQSTWTFTGFSPALPAGGAEWTVVARAANVRGKAAQTAVPVVVLPRKGIQEVKAWEDEGFNLPPLRLDGEKRASTACTDPSSGKARVTAASGGNPARSPAMNIATSFLGEADGVWGWGWVSEHDQRLRLRPSGAVLYTDGAGRRLNFFPPAPGAADPDLYRSPLQDFRALRVTERSNGAPTRFELRDKDAAVLAFARTPGTQNFPLAHFSDRNGNTLSYEPDGQGRLGVVRDRHGRTLTVAYDAGRVASVTDDSGLAGRVVRYYYDAAGRRTSETGPKGTTLYDYESPSSTRIAKVTFPNGGYRAFDYDASGRVRIQTDLLDTGLTTQTRYEYYPSSTVVIDPMGKPTVLDMAKRGGLKRPVRVEAPGATTFSEYDPATFNLTRSSDARGNATAFTYGDKGNVEAIAAPEDTLTSLAYHPVFNRPTSVINPRRFPTTFGYNQATGDLETVTDAKSQSTLLTYDPFGHVTSVKDPAQGLTAFTYTAGQLTRVTDAEDRATVLTRDSVGRVETALDPDTRLTRYGYDEQDNLTSVTDARDGVTNYAYGAGVDGKLLSSVEDARQAVGTHKKTRFTYDKAGRLKRVDDPNDLFRTYAYDEAGRLTGSVDAMGKPFGFTYDDNDRLDLKTTPDGVFDFDFDPNGNLTKAQHPNGTRLEQTFDALDRARVVVQTLPNGHRVSLTNVYDKNGNREQLQTPWGTFVFHYDELDRMDGLTPPGGYGSFGIAYDPAGRRQRLQYPHPDVRADYEYDKAGLLLSVEHKKIAPTFTLLARASYSYSDAGDRLTMSDLDGTHSFVYDELHRLILARHHPMAPLEHLIEAFDYDRAGNRTADNAIVGYSYDAGNRLLENSSYTFLSDDNGNITRRTDKADLSQARLEYDAENRLKKVTRPDGATVEFKRDAQGRRVEKVVTAGAFSQTRRYVYDNEDILAILDENNALVTLFTHGPGIDEPLMMVDQGQPRIFMADGLGSIKAVATMDGTIIERIDYTAYGKPTYVDLTGPTPTYSNASITGNPHAFTARLWDPEIELQDNRERTYDWESGRFAQADPIGIDAGANLFQYSNDAPTRQVDPFGLDSIDYNIVRLPLVSAGFIFDAKGVRPYIGPGFVTPGWSLSVSHQNPSPGLNFSAQIAVPGAFGLPLSIAFTRGFDTRTLSPFSAIGVGTPGGSTSLVYVKENPIDWFTLLRFVDRQRKRSDAPMICPPK